MAERKVLNKYYPPDFDPSALSKTTKPKNKQVLVRLMLPMSIQCQTCGDYIHKGKKFNGRKEEAVGEAYLGIKVWRFYLKCPTCLSEVTFKTDPQRNGYTVERGASRNYEPWRQISEQEKLEAAKKEREEKGDTMKALENRTEASKREMDIQDAIEEVRERNARAQALSTDQLIDIHAGGAARWEEAQIEEMAAQAFARKRGGALTGGGVTAASSSSSTAASSPLASAGESSLAAVPSVSSSGASSSSSSSTLPVLKRLPDAVDLSASDFRPLHAGAHALDQLEVPDSPNGGDADDASALTTHAVPAAAALDAVPAVSLAAPAAAAAVAPLAGLLLVKKRKADDPEKEKKKKKAKKEKKEAAEKAAAAGQATTDAAPSGLGSLLGAYGDDSD